MLQTKQLFLLLAILVWAIIIGGIMYSHVAVMPSFLHHLPQSAGFLNSGQGVEDERFWMTVHPAAMLLTIVSLILYWKHKTHRKLILVTLSMYVLILISTASYFVPELMRFASSNTSTSVSADDVAATRKALGTTQLG